VTRHLHHFHGKFDTVISLYTKLIEALKDDVPNNLTFSVGYFEGQKHSKVSIASNDDLKAMYKNYPVGEITLWCDARCEESAGKKKRKRVESSYHGEEEEVDKIYMELREKHLEYDIPRLRLWARIISSNLHESTDEPPNIPAFCRSAPKKVKQDLTSALSGAAVAFANVVGKANGDKACSPPQATSNGCPSTLVDVRMKNYEQLRYIKQLHLDGILTDKEFDEQKENILCAIRKLD
jgi:hypothetical protein